MNDISWTDMVEDLYIYMYINISCIYTYMYMYIFYPLLRQGDVEMLTCWPLNLKFHHVKPTKKTTLPILPPKESMINDAVAIVVFEIMNSAEVAQNGKRPMCFFSFKGNLWMLMSP